MLDLVPEIPPRWIGKKKWQKESSAGDTFYIDGTSALILSEKGFLEEVYQYMPSMHVPQSVIAQLLKYKQKFIYIPGQVGYMQYVGKRLRVSEIDPVQREEMWKNFENSVKVLESKPENISVISAASKLESFVEQEIPAELCDACILAQENEMPVLTEDYLYLQTNAIMTGKRAPEYCSAFALMRTLYEQKKMSFERFLFFFGYLSSYRFRLLPVTVDDIEKAVFGDGVIRLLQPERIKWLNFPLTLSEDYGVSFASAFRVTARFLIRVLIDDAVLPDFAERIFIEILSSFPTDKDKSYLGQLLLAFSAQEIEKMHGQLTIGTAAKNKISRLSTYARIYRTGSILWTPPN